MPDIYDIPDIRFQSTFPRGERPFVDSFNLVNLSFNPRSREGNDWFWPPVFLIVFVFQSTFPRGERRCSRMLWDKIVMFQSTFPRGERQQLPIIFIYSPCSFLCNYTNRFLSIQVLPPITPLFSLILYKHSGANLPGNTCLLAVRTHTLPHWPVHIFPINMFPVNVLYKVHLYPSHSECRISSDMQSLCRIQPWDKRRQLPLVFHLSRHPAEIHFSIYTI